MERSAFRPVSQGLFPGFLSLVLMTPVSGLPHPAPLPTTPKKLLPPPSPSTSVKSVDMTEEGDAAALEIAMPSTTPKKLLPPPSPSTSVKSVDVTEDGDAAALESGTYCSARDAVEGAAQAPQARRSWRARVTTEAGKNVLPPRERRDSLNSMDGRDDSAAALESGAYRAARVVVCLRSCIFVFVTVTMRCPPRVCSSCYRESHKDACLTFRWCGVQCIDHSSLHAHFHIRAGPLSPHVPARRQSAGRTHDQELGRQSASRLRPFLSLYQPMWSAKP